MIMNPGELIRIQELLKRFTASDKPTKANMAVFYDEKGKMLYAGIISNWPIFITTDIEIGEVKEMDATKEPYASKAVRFFSPFRIN
jgi:hypothetical protein